jgi:hypothetical protein
MSVLALIIGRWMGPETAPPVDKGAASGATEGRVLAIALERQPKGVEGIVGRCLLDSRNGRGPRVG